MHSRGSIVELPVNRDQRSGSRQQAVRDHLERLLRSAEFDASARSRAFLRFVVDQALDGHEENLNQAVIAAAVFGRKSADFDAVLDPIVRVQAARLRRSLERYYLLTGDTGPIQTGLPKGGYVPVFETLAPGDRGGDASVSRSATVTRASGWPGVLVHPVQFSPPLDAQIASRMKDELTMELCRHGDVRIMRRIDADASTQGPSARFELRSGLRREGDTYDICARLVDRTTGQQIWSDEYQTGPRSAFQSSVDDVARVIACRVGAEHGVMARVLAGGPRVVATGGGAFMNDATRARIADNAISIWLKADLDTLMRRVRKRATRPLLQKPDPVGTMQRLLSERSKRTAITPSPSRHLH